MLRAMQTVFLSNDRMDQARFSQYHASLRSPLQPGSYTSIAFARREPAGQPLADHVSYRYAYVAPYEPNTSLIGFDMVTQKANLTALLQARNEPCSIIHRRGSSLSPLASLLLEHLRSEQQALT